MNSCNSPSHPFTIPTFFSNSKFLYTVYLVIKSCTVYYIKKCRVVFLQELCT